MNRKGIAFLFALVAYLGSLSAQQSLAEKLGYKPTDKLLIINVNDAGLCHATNEATESALKAGTATSASIIIPSSWTYEIASFAKRNSNYCFGIQLTLTNERTKNYAWACVAPSEQVASILDTRGAMYSELDDLYKNAVLSEVELELRAQILKAHVLGITPYFINSHWGALSYEDSYWNLLVHIASDYQLPIRFNSSENFHGNDIKARKQLLDSLGILYPDHLIWDALDNVRNPQDVASALDAIIDSLQPGVTELFLTPANLSPELKTITHDYMFRVAEMEWLASETTKKRIADAGIALINYKALWERQQKK